MYIIISEDISKLYLFIYQIIKSKSNEKESRFNRCRLSWLHPVTGHNRACGKAQIYAPGFLWNISSNGLMSLSRKERTMWVPVEILVINFLTLIYLAWIICYSLIFMRLFKNLMFQPIPYHLLRKGSIRILKNKMENWKFISL